MEVITKEIGWKINNLEKEFLAKKMVKFLKDFGLMDLYKGKESTFAVKVNIKAIL